MASPPNRGPGLVRERVRATSNAALLTTRSRPKRMHISSGGAIGRGSITTIPPEAGAKHLSCQRKLRSTARVLARTYPEAIAGTPLCPLTRQPAPFNFAMCGPRCPLPTVIFVPTQIHYPNGYALKSAGNLISKTGSELLDVKNARVGRTVRISVSSGAC